MIQAGARFSVRLSVQNTGDTPWQSYGLRVKLYNSKRRLVKFPAGSELSYSVTAPWPAGFTGGIDAPIILPGLHGFMAENLPSGVYYYLPELFACGTAVTGTELFRKAPVHKGSLREVRVYNPSVNKRNAAVTAVEVSSASVRVRLKNFGNTNLTGLVLKLFHGGAPAGERAVEVLAARQELEAEFSFVPAAGENKEVRAVLVADDDFQEDNYLTAGEEGR